MRGRAGKGTAAQLTGALGIESVQVDDGYVGDGYGLPTKGTFRAIDLAPNLRGCCLTRYILPRALTVWSASFKTAF